MDNEKKTTDKEEKVLTKDEIEQVRGEFIKEAAQQFKKGVVSMEEEAPEKLSKKTLAETLGVTPHGKRDEKSEKPYGRII